MRKVITICDKEYTAQSSAYTQFKYKNDTGRSLMSDLQRISKLDKLDLDVQVEGIDDLLETILKMAYIMIEEADSSQVTTFEDFLKDLDGLFDEQQWLMDIIELAQSPFSRGNKTDSQ